MFAVSYKGCYVDNIDRDFDDERIDSQNQSVTFCAGQCAIKGKGHKPSDYAILYCVRKENDLRNLQVRGACGCLYSQKSYAEIRRECAAAYNGAYQSNKHTQVWQRQGKYSTMCLHSERFAVSIHNNIDSLRNLCIISCPYQPDI